MENFTSFDPLRRSINFPIPLTTPEIISNMETNVNRVKAFSITFLYMLHYAALNIKLPQITDSQGRNVTFRKN